MILYIASIAFKSFTNNDFTLQRAKTSQNEKSSRKKRSPCSKKNRNIGRMCKYVG